MKLYRLNEGEIPVVDPDQEALHASIGVDPWRMEWLRISPFIALHLSCVAVYWVGWSPVALAIALISYLVRMFAVTGFYHRYFSHRTFRTSRLAQFAFAVWGNAAAQRGPLWWAGHHRHHHQHSDQEEDVHSAQQRGFWWSHLLWIVSRAHFPTRLKRVHDLAAYPELCFLNRYDYLVPILLALGMYGLGELLALRLPGLGTDGLQMVVWGFCISTVALFHATSTINSLSHCFGSQRYPTGDQSRNNGLLALLTMGEGWHNNHHYCPGATRQGFFWWEVDLTYYGLKVLAWLGVIWKLHPVPEHAYREAVKKAG